MQLPAFPAANDPCFQDLLAKASARPIDAPATPDTDSWLDLEACKQGVRAALAWAALNVGKWLGIGDATPAPQEAVREEGGVIARFFRRLAGWLKKGFCGARDLFVRAKNAVRAAFGAKQSTPASESAPPQAAATEVARAPEQKPASAATSSGDATAEAARDVLSGLRHREVGIAGDAIPKEEQGVLGISLGSEMLRTIEKVLSTTTGRTWTQEQIAKHGHASSVG